MGFIPRRRIKENLRDVEVFLEDRDNTIFKVQDVPDTFVQGRSAFKIFGSEFLKVDVPLKIEILDKWYSPESDLEKSLYNDYKKKLAKKNMAEEKN